MMELGLVQTGIQMELFDDPLWNFRNTIRHLGQMYNIYIGSRNTIIWKTDVFSQWICRALFTVLSYLA
jgi:hypothetical protein